MARQMPAAAALLLWVPTLLANSGGITGRSGNPATGGSTCAACHGGGGFSYNLPSIAGSTSVLASTTSSYTLNFTKAGGADAVLAGFNLSVTGGTLVDSNAAGCTVRKSGAELTHSSPCVPSGGNFSWEFSWTAPSAPGAYTFYVCNNPVNGNGTTSGDGGTRCSSLVVAVDAGNSAPSAANDSYSTPHNTSLAVEAPGVLDNDTDTNGDTLSATLDSNPGSGSVTLDSAGGFTYTPDNGFAGTDSFTYRASDGSTASDAATVTITVGVQNTAPQATNDSYNVTAGSTLTVVAPGVLGNDSDVDNDSLTAAPIASPTHGSLALNANGAFTYTPDGGFSGADSFTYQASDGTVNSNVATVTLAVNPAPPPVDGGGGGGGGGSLPWDLLVLLAAARRLRRTPHYLRR